MDFKEIINSPGMWLVSGIMVSVVLLQAASFLHAGFKAADGVGLSKDKCYKAVRSAIFTAIGPAMGPVIILIALIDVVGAPTAWMRLNDIGAARTELVSAGIAAQTAGVDLKSIDFGLREYSYVLWSMAITNVGWILVALFLTHRMAGMIKTMEEKTNKTCVSMITTGASIGLFTFLMCNQLVGAKTPNLIAAVVSGVTMLALGILAKKYSKMAELSLGVAMIVGMFVANVFK